MLRTPGLRLRGRARLSRPRARPRFGAGPLRRRGRCAAAPRTTVRPSATRTRASLPVVVVLPTPFTPTTITTAGPSPSARREWTVRSASVPFGLELFLIAQQADGPRSPSVGSGLLQRTAHSLRSFCDDREFPPLHGAGCPVQSGQIQFVSHLIQGFLQHPGAQQQLSIIHSGRQQIGSHSRSRRVCPDKLAKATRPRLPPRWSRSRAC